MGLERGAYCLRCCWALMPLLFAVGVVNLLGMAALTAFLLVEKLFPAGQWVARAGGILALAFRAFLVTQGD
jgi:predicted metal-binding membrane protein